MPHFINLLFENVQGINLHQNSNALKIVRCPIP